MKITGSKTSDLPTDVRKKYSSCLGVSTINLKVSTVSKSWEAQYTFQLKFVVSIISIIMCWTIYESITEADRYSEILSRIWEQQRPEFEHISYATQFSLIS